MNPKLTFDQEMEIEWNHIYETRIAIMCGNSDPNPKQIHIAKMEADEAVKALRNERKGSNPVAQ